MKTKSHAVCQFCGKREPYTECSEMCAPPEGARCAVLDGWLSVTHWRGMGSLDRYDFCSLTCFQKWVEVEVPKVPKASVEAFQGK